MNHNELFHWTRQKASSSSTNRGVTPNLSLYLIQCFLVKGVLCSRGVFKAGSSLSSETMEQNQNLLQVIQLRKRKWRNVQIDWCRHWDIRRRPLLSRRYAPAPHVTSCLRRTLNSRCFSLIRPMSFYFHFGQTNRYPHLYITIGEGVGPPPAPPPPLSQNKHPSRRI